MQLGRRRPLLGLVAVVIAVAALTRCTSSPELVRPSSIDGGVATAPPAMASPTTTVPAALARDLEPYRGLGAWVDVFNYAPQYQTEGHPAPITPTDVDEMHRRGVHTLFLQATRWDDASPRGFADETLAGSFLERAHDLGMPVVGWYLPRLVDPTFDVIRAKQIVDFRSARGDRFDGLAVDIEYTEGEPDVARRNANLVAFATTLRAAVPSIPIGAIILSSVHLEVVNTNFWPAFPYADIHGAFDVWLPMAYWTIRLDPYLDGYRYAKESVDRLRADLGDPGAVVAPIGGIADEMTDEQIAAFGRALQDLGAIGGSFYNWNTMAPGKQALARDLFTTGPAAVLPAPPGR